ncbi:MAG: ATP-binding cassette domain-containing protein, partial [Actinomycetota bacterium]|nr:ATP-binding cassette domain-containing protein [Actinomycetota bacterium]
MIRTLNVSKEYKGGIRALEQVTIDIEKGEFVFLVGPSGSGKSTFLKLLTKEEAPTSGDVFVAGKNLNSLPRLLVPYLRRNVGCVFQDFKLLPNKT